MEPIDISPVLFVCKACGLHYHSEATAKECAEWCVTYASCNMDITAQSIERAPK